MTRKSKIKKGFYPINLSDIRRMIGYCDSWGFGNKDTCKYVAENVIEHLSIDYPELPIRESLYSDLISFVHDINNGARRDILIPIE